MVSASNISHRNTVSRPCDPHDVQLVSPPSQQEVVQLQGQDSVWLRCNLALIYWGIAMASVSFPDSREPATTSAINRYWIILLLLVFPCSDHIFEFTKRTIKYLHAPLDSKTQSNVALILWYFTAWDISTLISMIWFNRNGEIYLLVSPFLQ